MRREEERPLGAVAGRAGAVGGRQAVRVIAKKNTSRVFSVLLKHT